MEERPAEMPGRSTRRREAQRRTTLARVTRWRCAPDAPCDICGVARTHLAPLCAEQDPFLISFWISACEHCITRRDLGEVAYKTIHERGWARGGPTEGSPERC